MRILFLGDVVGGAGRAAIAKGLSLLKREEKIDMTVINGENSDTGNGISGESAEELIFLGADVITTGNHVYKKSAVYDYLDESKFVLRPVNYPSQNPGRGYGIYECGGARVLVINVLGIAFMDAYVKNPFDAVDEVLLKTKGEYDVSVLDIHAESTSEKIAIAHFFDSRIDLIVGTHTHVQTADERILAGGSAYITDAGMCGTCESALGVDFEPVIRRFRTSMPQRFTEAKGECFICGVVADIDIGRKRPATIKRIMKRV